jgi:hypothetical protein
VWAEPNHFTKDYKWQKMGCDRLRGWHPIFCHLVRKREMEMEMEIEIDRWIDG